MLVPPPCGRSRHVRLPHSLFGEPNTRSMTTPHMPLEAETRSCFMTPWQDRVKNSFVHVDIFLPRAMVCLAVYGQEEANEGLYRERSAMTRLTSTRRRGARGPRFSH